MDIHCRYCGEPWDHDELHDMEDACYKDAGQAVLKAWVWSVRFRAATDDV